MGKSEYVSKGEPTIRGCSKFIFLGLFLGLGLGFWAGVHFAGTTIPEVAQRALAQWSEAHRNISSCDESAQRAQTFLNQEQEGRKWEQDIYVLALQREALKDAVLAIFFRHDFKWSLRVDWNKKKLEPWTPVLLFNVDALPKKFKEKRGGSEFIYRHNYKRGELAIFMGEKDGAITVLHLGGKGTAIENGGLLTFEPEQQFLRQRAFVYKDERP